MGASKTLIDARILSPQRPFVIIAKSISIIPVTILQLSLDLIAESDLKIACFGRKIGPIVLAQPLGYPWENLANIQ
jgi:hypothetical protein